ASADVESIAPGPYFAWYAATNSEFPAEFSASYQSPVVKIPLTLPAPTLSGKFTVSFAPLVMNRYVGLNFCSTMALTSANASFDCVPATTRSGFAAAILATIGVMSTDSEG